MLLGRASLILALEHVSLLILRLVGLELVGVAVDILLATLFVGVKRTRRELVDIGGSLIVAVWHGPPIGVPLTEIVGAGHQRCYPGRRRGTRSGPATA